MQVTLHVNVSTGSRDVLRYIVENSGKFAAFRWTIRKHNNTMDSATRDSLNKIGIYKIPAMRIEGSDPQSINSSADILRFLRGYNAKVARTIAERERYSSYKTSILDGVSLAQDDDGKKKLVVDKDEDDMSGRDSFEKEFERRKREFKTPKHYGFSQGGKTVEEPDELDNERDESDDIMSKQEQTPGEEEYDNVAYHAAMDD